MKKFLFTISIVFIFLVTVFANQREHKSFGIPYFHVVTPGYPLESVDSTKLDVIVKIPNDAIQFLKKGTDFEAKYELSIIVQDIEGNQIEERIKQNVVSTNRYRETISPQLFDLVTQTFRLSPNEYKCIIELTDQDTRKSGRQTININLERFKDIVAISDVLLLDTREKTDDFPLGLPLFPARITDVDSVLHIYYRARLSSGEYEFTTKVISIEDEILSKEEITKNTTVPIVEELLEHKQFDVPGNKFKIQISIEQEEKSSLAELVVEVKWRGITTHVSDLDEAIEQIRYIATRDELVNIQRAGEKKEELFKQFWKDRDPSPNTSQNELMNEYFKRVEYTNEKFGTFRDGWKTAMGMIFILFGPPDDIEVNHFARDGKSYQRWHYFIINRSFLFVDYNGFGDYELYEPYYPPYGTIPR